MKIAMTGGTGIMGKSLQLQIPENSDVVILSRKPVPEYDERYDTEWPHVQTDYSPASLKEIFTGCDAVVHLAAQRLNKDVPDRSFQNVPLDYTVFKACKTSGISNVVFASSRGVYGSNPDVPWTEEHDPAPENPYALAKYLSEKTADYFNYQGMSIKCLRFAQVMSPFSCPGYALGTFIQYALNGKPIHVSASKSQVREYVYVKDVSEGILAALRKPDIKGIFNFGSGEAISIPRLAKMIHSTFDGAGTIINQEQESAAKEHSLMDSRLFYRTFGFRIQWDLASALVDIRNKLKKPIHDTF